MKEGGSGKAFSSHLKGKGQNKKGRVRRRERSRAMLESTKSPRKLAAHALKGGGKALWTGKIQKKKKMEKRELRETCLNVDKTAEGIVVTYETPPNIKKEKETQRQRSGQRSRGRDLPRVRGAFVGPREFFAQRKKQK